MRFLKLKAALVVVVVGAVATGVAIAAWTGPGRGEGYGKATQWRMLTTEDVSARLTGDIYPGGTGDLAFEWHNPNPFPVQLTEIVSAGPFIIDDGHPECVNHGLHFADLRGQDYVVGPGESEGIIIIGGLTMDGDADDGCQGAGFSLPVVARGIIIIGG